MFENLGALVTVGFSLLFFVIVLLKSVKIVPQNHVFVVERLGKFSRELQAGFHVITPFLETVAYDVNLKEEAIDVPTQITITGDNISIEVDGVLYLKVLDASSAVYNIEDYLFAVASLAQTTMRSVIGTMDLNDALSQRATMNDQIVKAVGEAAKAWGVQVLRYEISNITPPKSVTAAMEQQLTADRTKKAEILKSEGQMQSEINIAEGEKQSAILKAQGEKESAILKAQGEAESIELMANAESLALEKVGKAAATEDGQKAVQLTLAKGAIEAQQALAKASTTMIVPATENSIASTVAQAAAISSAISNQAA